MDSTLGDKAKEVFEFQTKMSDLKKTSSRSVRQKGQKNCDGSTRNAYF